MTAAELVAALKALPAAELDLIRSELLTLAHSRPRDEKGLTPLDRAYVDALVVYKNGTDAGESKEVAFEMAVASNLVVAEHEASFKRIALEGNRRYLHTLANKERRSASFF